MLSKIGYNCQTVPNQQDLIWHIERLGGPGLLLQKNINLKLIQDLSHRWSDKIIIARNYISDEEPDEKIHLFRDAAAWFNEAMDGLSENVYLMTTNEPGMSEQLVSWHYDVCRLAIERKRPVVIWNPSNGNYDRPDFVKMKQILKLAGENPKYIVIGLHQYAGGIITSGIHYEGMENSTPTHILPETWGDKASLEARNKFHIGRQNFLYSYCDAEGIKRPRVFVTELGFDDTTDIEEWLDSLQRPEGTEIAGWKTLEEQWKIWFRHWSSEEAFVRQIRWAEHTLLSNIEAAFLFIWGGYVRWQNYRVDNSLIPQYMESILPYTSFPTPVPSPTPIPIPIPPQPPLPIPPSPPEPIPAPTPIPTPLPTPNPQPVPPVNENIKMLRRHETKVVLYEKILKEIATLANDFAKYHEAADVLDYHQKTKMFWMTLSEVITKALSEAA